MRILQVNKFGTATSGADKYFVELSHKLADTGHEVASMCMRPRDLDHRVETYEVPDLDFHEAGGIRGRLRAARTVWSGPAAASTMERAVREFRPDVVHFHNIAHHLSHRVVAIARRHGLPTFMTCHDYKLVCPSYLALRDGRVCFDCASGVPAGCAVHRCMHGSVAWSTLASAEAMRVRSTPGSSIPGTLICPSEFMHAQFTNSWLASTDATIATVPNPVDFPGQPRPRSGGSPAIFVGRLSEEKGVHVAVAAAAVSNVPLVVVGEGPARAGLEVTGRDGGSPTTFVGFQSGAALEALWDDAGFLVAPSTCPENYPLAVLEATARGIPCIASDIGGLPEIVRHAGAGALVIPGDVDDLATAMARGAAHGLGMPDVAGLRSTHSWDVHLGRLHNLYEAA